MDITNQWKDAYLDLHCSDEEVIVKLGNIDAIVIKKTSLDERRDELHVRLSALREHKNYAEIREKFYELKYKEVRGNINNNEIVKLIFNILYGELLKYEKEIELSFDKIEKLLQQYEK